MIRTTILTILSGSYSLWGSCGALALFACAATAQETCEPAWAPEFASYALKLRNSGTRPSVRALSWYDDGNGEKLIVAGTFDEAGGMNSSFVTAFNGENYEGFGRGIRPDFGTVSTVPGVFALLPWSNANGPALVAGGAFYIPAFNSRAIAVWQNGVWQGLGGGFEVRSATTVTTRINALALFDSGTGPELYAAGFFDHAGGMPIRHIARFDGTTWQPVVTGLGNEVFALQVFDDGTGLALYAAGRFTNAGTLTTGRVARFDGTQWSVVGTPPLGPIRDLEVYDDGSGAKLIAIGKFGLSGTTPTVGVAQWDGTSWTQCATPISFGPEEEDGGYTLGVRSESNGDALYLGGRFQVPNTTIENVARWNGAAWTALDGGVTQATVNGYRPTEVRALATDGPAGSLQVGGRFDAVGASANLRVSHLATFNGNEWHAIGRGHGFDGETMCAIEWNDGTGNALYVGGAFETAGTVTARSLARWNGSWEEVGSGVFYPNGPGTVNFTDLASIRDMLVWDDGSGSALFVAGKFEFAGGIITNSIAKWDGANFSALGQGLRFMGSGFSEAGTVRSLALYDDGAGTRLFACGTFHTAGGVPVNGLAAWDGSNWAALPGWRVTMPGPTPNPTDLLTHDDGSGPELWIGGSGIRLIAPSLPVMNAELVRFDGARFVEVDLGGGPVFDLVLHASTLGGTPELYLSGGSPAVPSFQTGLSRWTPPTFTSVSVSATDYGQLTSHADETTGSNEIWSSVAGTTFFLPGGPLDDALRPVSSAQAFGTDGELRRLVSARALQGEGQALYALGDFGSVNSVASGFFAEYSRECVGESFCFGDGGVTANCTPCPCGNNSAAGSLTGCRNSSGNGARVSAAGSASVAADSLRLTANGLPSSGLALLFSGATRLPDNLLNPCFGLNSGIANLGDGLRCMGGSSLLRHGVRGSDTNGDIGATTPGYGPPDGPAGGLAASVGFNAGQTRHFQLFFRDATSAGCGSGLNSSQGLSVTWIP